MPYPLSPPLTLPSPLWARAAVETEGAEAWALPGAAGGYRLPAPWLVAGRRGLGKHMQARPASPEAQRFAAGFCAMICQLVVKSPSLSASTKDWPPSTRRSRRTLKCEGMTRKAVRVSTTDLKVV